MKVLSTSATLFCPPGWGGSVSASVWSLVVRARRPRTIRATASGWSDKTSSFIVIVFARVIVFLRRVLRRPSEAAPSPTSTTSTTTSASTSSEASTLSSSSPSHQTLFRSIIKFHTMEKRTHWWVFHRMEKDFDKTKTHRWVFTEWK